jgi:nickel-dependent lactate racemase
MFVLTLGTEGQQTEQEVNKELGNEITLENTEGAI